MPLKDKTARVGYQQAYHVANKDRARANGKAWRAKNKEKVIADRRNYKSAHRDKINAQERVRYHEQKHIKKELWKIRWTRDNRRRPALNLARNEAALGRKRPEVCDACGGNDDGIVFDHCHKHGHARGWLCHACNRTLGAVKDDIDRLYKLIAYLKRTAKMTSRQLTISGI